MAIDLTALRAEILTDPEGLGYPPWAGDPGAIAKQIADLLNADRQVLGFRRNSVPATDVRCSFDPSELAILSSVTISILQLYVSGDTSVDFGNVNVEEILRTSFLPGSTTRANLVSLAQRSTRAWELFGQGSRVAWNRHVLPALRMS